MIVIGLTGVKQSGKTTSFNILKDIIPSIEEIQLAKKLKDTCSLVLDLPRTHLDDQNLKERELEVPRNLSEKLVRDIFAQFNIMDPDFDEFIRPHINKTLHSPREALQYIGTEVLRNYDSDIHCKGSIQDVNPNGCYILTDMRFTNEFEFFHNKEGVYLIPLHIHNREAEYHITDSSHPSEKEVLATAKKCHLVDNNGSISDLTSNLISAVSLNLIKTINEQR